MSEFPPSGDEPNPGSEPPLEAGGDHPDSDHPELVHPESAQSDANRPDANRPDANRPDANRPDANRPDEDGSDRDPVRGVHRPRRLRLRLRTIAIGVLLLATVVAVVAGWLLYKGLQARNQLQLVRAEVHQLRVQIDAGDLGAARVTAAEISIHAKLASHDTSGPLWSAAQLVPIAGRPLRDVRTIAQAVSDIADGALPSLIDASTSLDPKTIRGPDGRVNLAPIERVAPALDRAAKTMHLALHRINNLSGSTWLPSVDRARADVIAQLTPLTHTLDSADVAAGTAPAMLGADRPKYYMVSFENEAELRGTGGLPGSFAIMKADNGRLSFVKFESDSRLENVKSGLEFGSDFDATYDAADVTGDYRDANVSPNFPYAAQIWVAEWRAATGQQLDGAMTMDPTALSYLLNVTGPAILPDGSRINAGNVIQQTQQGIYAKFSGSQTAQRKAYLLDIARAVSQRLIATHGSTTALIRAAGRAAAERRLLLWSSDPSVEARLATTSMGGAVGKTAEPYGVVAINNAGANKLDYYLKASMNWVAHGCGASRSVTVSISLTNGAPVDLPPFVYGVTGQRGFPKTPGDNQLLVAFYGTAGGHLTSVLVNGAKSTTRSGRELGHPVYTMEVQLARAETKTITFNLAEPGAGTPTLRLQPMVVPMTGHASASPC